MAKISKSDKLRQWTKEELNNLKREYPKTDTKFLAKRLGRSLEAVRFKAKHFGLKKTKVYMEDLYIKARKAGKKRTTRKK
jgi:transcriptional regulator of aromatic amino acid metabolism